MARIVNTRLVIFGCVVSLVVGVLVGTRAADSRWTPKYDNAISISQDWQRSSEQYQSQLQDLETNVTSSVGDLESPHFVLWNSCGAGGAAAGCPLTPGHEYVGGVPDTFTYTVSFKSTVPVTVWIMSTSDFVCWETKECDYPSAVGWENLTSLAGVDFHDAEGCAGYIAVFYSDSAGTLYPNVSITRNPSPVLTGACAQDPPT